MSRQICRKIISDSLSHLSFAIAIYKKDFLELKELLKNRKDNKEKIARKIARIRGARSCLNARTINPLQTREDRFKYFYKVREFPLSSALYPVYAARFEAAKIDRKRWARKVRIGINEYL